MTRAGEAAVDRDWGTGLKFAVAPARLLRTGFPCPVPHVPHPSSIRRRRGLAAACVEILAGFPGAGRAGTAVRLDLQGLVDCAEICIEGRVLDMKVELDLHGRPCTRATLAVTRDLLGVAEGSLDLRIPGGVLPDGSGLVLAGMPSLYLGEEVVLFLSEESSAGLRIPSGLAQGKFRIARDAQGGRTLVRDDADLELLDLASMQKSHANLAAVYDYAAFMAEVQAAVAHRRALPHSSPPFSEGK